MSHKCWGKLDLTAKCSEPFSLRIKYFPSLATFENSAPSLAWLTYYPALVGFNFSVEFCTVFFSCRFFVWVLCPSQTPQTPYKDVFMDFRDSLHWAMTCVSMCLQSGVLAKLWRNLVLSYKTQEMLDSIWVTLCFLLPLLKCLITSGCPPKQW